MTRRLGVAVRLAVPLLAGSLVIAGCKGEDRPNVDVIGGAGNVSISASSIGPAPSAGGAQSTGGGTTFAVATNVDIYFQMGLDLRDMKAALAQNPPDWAAAKAVYEQGKNQAQAGGTARPLASLPNDSVHAVFPNGTSVYGRPNFIDSLIKDGLDGTGRASGISVDGRRNIVDKGVQMLFYGKAMQEFLAAKTRLDTGAASPAVPVDETFAILAGSPEGETRPYSLLATARSRENDFKLQGQLVTPLELALKDAQAAATKGDKTALDAAISKGKGYMNAIFYLGTLRYAKLLESDTTQATRQTHLAEGWTFWQTIRATAASGSSRAAQDIEAAFTKDGSSAWTKDDTTKVYNALNEAAVLQALGIPATLQVKTPPAQ